jgi:hypothetical protein
MIEGCLPYYNKKNNEIEKAHNSKERPPFRAPPKHYAHGLKEYPLGLLFILNI